MELLLQYGACVAPSAVLLGSTLLVVPRRMLGARLALHLVFFVLLRDAMTPIGLWQLDGAGVALGIHFPHPALLPALACGCAALVAVLWLAEPDLRALVAPRPRSWPVALGLGLLGGVAIALPGHPHIPRPAVPFLLFSFIGNAYEELLFRGFLQGWMEQHVSAKRAAVLSGLAFASGHVFLATTVTSAGWPVLAFTLYEGLVCAELRRRQGLVAAIVAHGLGIFLLAR